MKKAELSQLVVEVKVARLNRVFLVLFYAAKKKRRSGTFYKEKPPAKSITVIITYH
jgi:hypothetical protein